jgi:hypothetical protein
MEGESKRAYANRTKVETKNIIIKEKMGTRNPEKQKRKNEFLKNKKNKKRKGGGMDEFGDSSSFTRPAADDNDDSFMTGERAVAAMADVVRFGEQAERPPVFRQLPRGAKEKLTPNQQRSKTMTKAEIDAESGAMELMRRKVLAQYAVMKAKRKETGDFHL